MVKLSGIRIPGYRMKDGQLIKTGGRKSVSQKIKEKKSKRVRVVKRGATSK